MKTLLKLLIPTMLLASILYVGCKEDTISPQRDNKPIMERRTATQISYANAHNPENTFGDDALELLEEFMQEHYGDALFYQDSNDSVYTDSSEANMVSVANTLWSGYSSPPSAVYNGYSNFQEATANMSDLGDEIEELYNDGLISNQVWSTSDTIFDIFGLADSTSLETVADSLKTYEDLINQDEDEIYTSNEKEALLRATSIARVFMSYFYNVDQGFETGEPASGFDNIITDITDDTEVALNTVAASMAQVAYLQALRGFDESDNDGLFAATVSGIWWVISYDEDRTFRAKPDGCPCVKKKSVDGSETECCCDDPTKSKCRPCSSGCGSSLTVGAATDTN